MRNVSLKGFFEEKLGLFHVSCQSGHCSQYETRFLPAAIGYVLFLLKWGIIVLHRFRGGQLADVALLFYEK